MYHNDTVERFSQKDMTMKSYVALALIIFSTISSASAECYGDAAHAFGCGVSRRSEATLETFGSSSNYVVPDYGTPQGLTVDDVYSPREDFQNFKRAIRTRRSNRWVENTYNRSMQSTARPLRSFGNVRFLRPRF
jgi:hypothetical protein